jgi:hypothetical protein
VEAEGENLLLSLYASERVVAALSASRVDGLRAFLRAMQPAW